VIFLVHPGFAGASGGSRESGKKKMAAKTREGPLRGHAKKNVANPGPSGPAAPSRAGHDWVFERRLVPPLKADLAAARKGMARVVATHVRHFFSSRIFASGLRSKPFAASFLFSVAVSSRGKPIIGNDRAKKGGSSLSSDPSNYGRSIFLSACILCITDSKALDQARMDEGKELVAALRLSSAFIPVHPGFPFPVHA